ncbi:histone deacetylase family protein [Indioceanicola profundi]|uniref:histone deacetylase family protein n=1 Tax=Indioceanicola profundi TaxID=2220096 RepID=UPI000E6ACD59|nr:histone deacetylase family protein [Indioceanicola profundi]
MHTALFFHPACLEHDTGEGHPECAQRVRAVLAALEDEAFMFLDRREAPRATRDQLLRVHPAHHIDGVLAKVPKEGSASIDDDTWLSPGSGEAALRAAGAVVGAVDAVCTGEVRNAFCAVRPPGHHAEPDQAMGFCLFNSIAVGAAHARAVHGLERVAIIDFDVHHGNGTQTVAEGDPNLFYGSTHQWPLYPGTGAAKEHGKYNNVVNACLPPMSGSPEFRMAVQSQLLPAIDAFRPDLIMISAGFDAHTRDPLAGLHLMEDDYAWVTGKLCELAAKHCDGRVVSALEGGYDLIALANSSAAHVKSLMVA